METDAAPTTPAFVSSNCNDEVINGVPISAVVVRGSATCADAKRIAALPVVKDKVFDFGAGSSYSCFYTEAGSARKYTCANDNFGDLEFLASN
jgi:hypothetical protein